MSSYNIVGIAYNLPESELLSPAPRELVILEACIGYCERLATDAALRALAKVPDGSRTVFGSGQGATLQQLDALTKELTTLRYDILTENARSFRRLAEARVEHPFGSGASW
ncbi:MAG: hypothetical protein IT439_04930 [Phycisphaerales bacterium]|nr:hypothetical protein [Phycisphaerales bacterium]